MLAKQNQYTEEFRRKAVKIYLNGNLSAFQLSKKLGIHENSMYRWIKTYNEAGFEAQQNFDEEIFLFALAQVEQKSDFKHTDILECIHDIKKQITEIERLVLQQANLDETKI